MPIRTPHSSPLSLSLQRLSFGPRAGIIRAPRGLRGRGEMPTLGEAERSTESRGCGAVNKLGLLDSRG